MLALDWLKYTWLRLKHPGRADYLSEGIGIEARAYRARRFWAKHLALCKEFQSKNLKPAGSIAVLGAGRLLDVNCDFLLKNYKTVHLFDADPGTLQRWKRLRGNAKVEFHHTELTGLIEPWTKVLQSSQSFIKSEPEFIKVLNQLLGIAPIEPFVGEFDAILSVNLLSQVPIYWRERVISLLKDSNIPIGDDEKLPQKCQVALDSTMSHLQHVHLNSLLQSAAQQIVLIFDTDFFHYKKDLAEWQCDPALYIGRPDNLEGFTQTAQDSWLWHIAPQGIEFKDYGAIHRVEARAFSRA